MSASGGVAASNSRELYVFFLWQQHGTCGPRRPLVGLPIAPHEWCELNHMLHSLNKLRIRVPACAESTRHLSAAPFAPRPEWVPPQSDHPNTCYLDGPRIVTRMTSTTQLGSHSLCESTSNEADELAKDSEARRTTAHQRACVPRVAFLLPAGHMGTRRALPPRTNSVSLLSADVPFPRALRFASSLVYPRARASA